MTTSRSGIRLDSWNIIKWKDSDRDLILTDADVTTLDPARPKARWVVIRDGKVLSLGEGEEWRAFRRRGERLINCRGMTLLPGFIDSHIHLAAYGESLVTLDLRPGGRIRSISDLVASIREEAGGSPPGTWIRGGGYDEFHLAEGRHPSRWDLDRGAPRHSVKLTHRSMHAHVLNSLALKRLGISRTTGDPPGGMIERDLKSGEPTGLLYEMGGFLSEGIPPLSGEEIERGIRIADRHLLSSGITSIQDVSAGNDGERRGRLESWKERGLLTPRIRVVTGLKSFEARGEVHAPGPLHPGPLREGGVKIILDETTGRLHPALPRLKELVLEIHLSGMQAVIHAVEERAVEAACEAISSALHRAPGGGHRHRIEHCALCPPPLARKIASLGILVVSQPSFLFFNGERYLERIPEDRLRHLYPFRTLIRAGVHVAGSSDCPLVPPDPLFGIAAAVDRRASSGEAVAPEQAIPVLDALRLYTVNAAWAGREEGVKGSIAPGKLADLVLLSGDPARLPPDEIRDLRVEMTLVGGRVVWRRGSQ